MSDSLQQLKKPPYFMLGILFFGAFVSFLNNSLLNVALPTIMADFEITSYATGQWLSTGYMLVSGILIPVSAFLLTKFTNRQLFITSMLLFTLGTAMAAFAPNFAFLLAGRMVQAAGSSVMSPLLMNTMLISFPREKRGTAMGVFGLVMIVAPALGPTLSGYIVQYYNWRLLFEMILPFAVISLVLAVFKLKNIMPTRHTTLDYWSVVLSTVGFGGLLYGFSTASSEGWSDPVVLITIIVGAIMVILFTLRQFKLDIPLLNLSVYKYPMFALASLISVVNSAALFSGMILTPAYVQSVRHISALDSGLMMLPGAIVMGIMSPITGKLFDKFGPRVLGIVGFTITCLTTYQMTHFNLDTTYAHIILIYSIRMFGISMVMMPIITNGLNQLPTRLNPHGTAVNNTLSQVAGALGTAVFVSIMNSRAESSITEQFSKVDLTTITDIEKAQITQLGLLEGIQFSFLIATLTTAVALILTFFMKRVDVSEEAVAKMEAVDAANNKS
ncbi:DHA2 family efflux MFS transporter permease subunit [Paenibacillus septentrionalis]|uniref:DHA2 family efflux MFS transporter permease subunit n=1 Tax=Paenibacillus septentrionalis TaxID=429342 RepID=A0ABW1VAL7_9BACL